MRLLFFLLIPFLILGQETTEKEKQLFIGLYTVGETWDSSKTPNEQHYFKEHATFLQRLRKDSTITIGARYAETGMIVFKAIDLEAAKRMLRSDSAIKNKLFNVEVHEFAPFYKGCIE